MRYYGRISLSGQIGIYLMKDLEVKNGPIIPTRTITEGYGGLKQSLSYKLSQQDVGLGHGPVVLALDWIQSGHKHNYNIQRPGAYSLGLTKMGHLIPYR